MAKHVIARMAQKIDSLENWNKATGFVPMDGEFFLVKDYDCPIVIGDGVRPASELAYEPIFNDVGNKRETLRTPNSAEDFDVENIFSYTISHADLDGNGEKYYLSFDGKVPLEDVKNWSRILSAGEHVVDWYAEVPEVSITIIAKGSVTNTYDKLRILVHLDVDNEDFIISEQVDISNYQEYIEYFNNEENGMSYYRFTGPMFIQGGVIGVPYKEYIEVGLGAHTEGACNIASIGAHAEGSNTRAIGYTSHTEGHNSEALGEYSHAQNWNTSAIGTASTAIGGASVSIGQYSTAMGGYCKSYGRSSLAAGERAITHGSAAIALGSNVRAKGNSSLAAGGSTHANNDYSLAIGHASAALSLGAIALGRECKAGGDATYANSQWTMVETAKGAQSFAGGLKSQSIGDQSFAFGKEAKTNGAQAFAVGNNAQALGESAAALGNGTIAYAFGAAVGKGNTSGAYGFAFGLNSLTNAYGLAGGNNSQANAEGAIAIGDLCNTAGIYSIVLGSNTTIGENGAYSFVAGRHSESQNYCGIALGHTAKALGNYAVAIGHKSEASAECAVALGHENKAQATLAMVAGGSNTAESTARASTAFGEKNIVSNSHSFVGGASSEAKNKYAFAFGRHAVAKGMGSIAIGTTNPSFSATDVSADTEIHEAGADYSTVLGRGCKTVKGATASVSMGAFNTINASGIYGLAVGRDNTVDHAYGVVLGLSLKTSASYQVVLGKYNAANTNASLIIGDGSSVNNPKNIFEVLKDGSVKMGNTIITETQLKSLLAILEKNPALATDTAITKDADGNIVLA